jgi:hypothetical protein
MFIYNRKIHTQKLFMLFMHEHEYLLPHNIHINCHITIMTILELLPQPPGIDENHCQKSLPCKLLVKTKQYDYYYYQQN